MKKEDLIQAINEVDDDLLERAQQVRMTPAKKPLNTKKLIISVTAAACAVALLAVINRKPDDENTPVAVDPVPQETDKPEPPAKDQLEVLTLTHQADSSGSMGFSIVLYPDLKREMDYNPWDESMNLKTLPVYQRIPSVTGIPKGLSVDEIHEKLNHYAEYFGLTVKEVQENTDENGEVYMLSAQCEEGILMADSYECTLLLKEDHCIPLANGLDFNRQNDEEGAIALISYLHDQYSELVHNNEWDYDIGGDYAYDGTRIRQYLMYEKGKTDEETILNYNFRKIAFAGSDDGTELSLIRISEENDAFERMGDYPLITPSEAYEELLKGNYFANTGGIGVDQSTEVGDVQLVYPHFRSVEYEIPCYQFLMDITDDARAVLSDLPGLRQYGIYLVPAVSSEYVKWADEPYEARKPQESVQQSEDNETGESTEPASAQEPQIADPAWVVTDEPAVIPPDEISVSKSVPMNRIVQEETSYCAVACGQMILDHFGISKSQQQLADEMNTYEPGERSDGLVGTYDSDVARVLNEYIFGGQPQSAYDAGYRVQPVSEYFVQSEYDTFVQRIMRNIDDGYPSILQIKVSSVYASSNHGNHNVLVTGYYKAGSDISFTILDPYYGGNSGTGYSDINALTLFRAIAASVEPSYIW